MLSLASLWPALNEPVLSLSCIIMNIHLCVCVCVGHWQALKKLLLSTHHNPSLCLDNKSSWQQFYSAPNTTKTGFVLRAKLKKEGFSWWVPHNVMPLFFFYSCLMKALDKRGERGRAWNIFATPGNRNALSHWHMLICLQNDVNNVVSMQMCILNVVINYIS